MSPLSPELQDGRSLRAFSFEGQVGTEFRRAFPQSMIGVEAFVGLCADRAGMDVDALLPARVLGEEITGHLVDLRGMYARSGLPLPDDAPASHPKVAEPRALSLWSEAQVWVSPERHGAMTGVLKCMVDWLPLEEGGVRPTQGRVLALMQVSGGSQSFNAVNQMRVLGRWMRMLTIPNQSSVPKVYEQFDEAGRMRPSPLYDRVVDVCEELVRFAHLARDPRRAGALVDRYSERRAALDEAAAASLADARAAEAAAGAAR